MSEHSHAPAPIEPEKFNARHAGLLPTICLGVGAVGLIGSLIGAFLAPEQFAYSWLFAVFYFFTLSAGSLFWTILHHATDAEWSVVVRRQMENLASLLPWFALFILPLIVFFAPTLWHWLRPENANDPLLIAKQGYLNRPFFYFRYVAFFVLLGGTALWLRGLSVAQDSDGKGRHTLLMRKISIAGLPAFAVSLTFAAIDYLMALDYHWFSTMWGVYIFAGAAGSSLSLLVLVLTGLQKRGYLKLVTHEHYHIIGKFMLAFTIFWAYIGFSQYMLIWYANIPEETIYFRIRNTETWVWFSTFLTVGRFFLPFPVLLLQWSKKNPQYLRYVAGWILFLQLVDMYVIVLPVLHPLGFAPSILDILAFAGVGGICGWLFFRVLGSAHLFPLRDPRLAGSVRLTN
ncbi:hypothetical protein ACXR0O_06185 [Verrucomicrobiota bacterium sgz303538]